jgi:hypothetical protein
MFVWEELNFSLLATALERLGSDVEATLTQLLRSFSTLAPTSQWSLEMSTQVQQSLSEAAKARLENMEEIEEASQ